MTHRGAEWGLSQGTQSRPKGWPRHRRQLGGWVENGGLGRRIRRRKGNGGWFGLLVASQKHASMAHRTVAHRSAMMVPVTDHNHNDVTQLMEVL